MKIELNDVQKTLLLPLWGRARLTRLGNPVLSDPIAVEIVDQIAGHDFEPGQKVFNDFFNVAWIARAKMFDDAIRDLLVKYPQAAVVNLGAGLDTTFFRVDNGQLRWYDLDLPAVIELRKAAIPPNERVTCIARSIFDPAWVAEISAGAPVMLISGGVLFYFPEAELKPLFQRLAASFPGGEFVFDVASQASLAYVNRGLQAAGLESAMLKWGIDDASTLCQWDPRITLLETYPMFSRLPQREYWGKTIQDYMAQSDATHSSSIVHLKFAG